jgi:hypothetical protein
MFSDILKRFKEMTAPTAWQRSPLGEALANHVNTYFTEIPRFAETEPEPKRELITDFYQRVSDVLQADNPRMKLRESLANYILAFAELAVLCLTEAEKRE